MTDASLYTTPEGFTLSRPLLLPDARSFSDVLEYLGEWDHETMTSQSGERGSDRPDGRIVGDKAGNYRRGNEIGPFCTIDLGGKHRSIAVRATDAVIEAVAPRIVTDDDSLSFRLILHKQTGRVLVILSHNYIIGSHWLAYIDPATIPAYPYEARDARYEEICAAIKEDGKDPFVKQLPGGDIEVRIITDRGRAPDFRRTLDPVLRATIHTDGRVTRVWADGTENTEPAR